MKTSGMITTIALCLGSITASYAQVYKDYDLSTYKTPDMVRNALDFTLNSEGEFEDWESSQYDEFAVKGELQTEFDRYKNTRSFWGTQQASILVGGDFNNNKGRDIKTNQYNVGASYYNTSRFYKPNEFFFETGGGASVNTYGSKNEKYVEGARKRGTSVNMNVLLGIGKGRIEQVQDARQAIYILENLSKRGVLNRKLTDAEIDAFAKTITTVKNKRFLDSRLRTIDEITTVDSFLVKNDLLASAGSSYFTTLYDYWMYGDRFQRGSGTVIKGGIKPTLIYSYYNNNETESHYRNTQPGISANVSLEYEKPVNLYWQHSANVLLQAGYNYVFFNQIEMNESKSDSYYSGLSGSYQWGYYPTSRTNINFGLIEQLSWGRNYSRGERYRDYADYSSRTGAFAQLYYYFSPQLRLSAQAGLDFYYFNNYKNEFMGDRDSAHLNGNFLLTLTYSLF